MTNTLLFIAVLLLAAVLYSLWKLQDSQRRIVVKLERNRQDMLQVKEALARILK